MSLPLALLLLPQAAAAEEKFLPHGYCFLWNKPLLWTHVASDLLIGASYVTISVSLAWLVHRVRRDIPFSTSFLMFGLFIVTCGLTHFLEVVTFWDPIYVALGGVKVVTAIASVATAVTMPFLVPRVHGTVRDARLSRDREIAAARAEVLEKSNLELTRLNERLQAALAEAEAARRSAEEARNAAEEANRAKSDFLAVMSHELRTPLNAVIGYAELLGMGVSGPVNRQQTMQLDRIGDSARHLVAVIEQILHFARVDAGREAVTYERFDLALLVTDTAEIVRPLAEQKGLELLVDVPSPGSTTIVSDARLTRQSVLNLLSNAIKYTPTGSVCISVEDARDGDTVRIRVEDTGIGIAPEHRSRIFEPFWQADPTHTRIAGGTGLGLSVTRQITGMLGGEVVFESDLGSGSVFTLVLPKVAPGGSAGASPRA